MLIVTGRSGSVQYPFLYIPDLDVPEVGESLIAWEFDPSIGIMDVAGFLNIEIRSVLVQIDAGCAVFVEPCCLEKVHLRFAVRRRIKVAAFPKILSVIDGRFDVVVARVGYEKRFSRIHVISVVIRHVLERIPVGEYNLNAVSVFESELVEIFDGLCDIDAAEFCLVLDRLGGKLRRLICV